MALRKHRSDQHIARVLLKDIWVSGRWRMAGTVRDAELYITARTCQSSLFVRLPALDTQEPFAEWSWVTRIGSTLATEKWKVVVRPIKLHEVTQPLGHRQHPLAHPRRGKTWSARCAARLCHAPGVARGAYATAFAGERHQKVMPAVITSGAGKAVGKDAALQVFGKSYVPHRLAACGGRPSVDDPLAQPADYRATLLYTRVKTRYPP